ncbi:hypothetical protein V5799_000430 [Amblyomma americanum]|uniref:THAP-type domain-containing protein n=1 Tax=Amblyomma americanum TaxID=6943 RepID=A0AAQ4D328_AMBAM
MGRCCVPGCRGNYDNGPKVRVLSFPKNEGRRQSWIRAIPRKDFTPSIHSKVCELHFQGSELITKLSHFDAASGKTVTVDSERVHLVPDAVPSIFLNCPAYLSTSSTRRESPASKRARMEDEALSKAIKNSIDTKGEEEERNAVSSLEDLKGKLSAVCNSQFWTVSVNDRCVMFLRIEDNPAPHVRFSVTVFADLSVSVSAGMIKLISLPCGRSVPDAVRDTRTLSLMLEQLKNHMTETPEATSASKTTRVLQQIGSLLNELSEDNDTTKEQSALFRLLNEQIALTLAAPIRRYSAETLVFSSILHSISPHAYNFARSASMLTLPHPSTLRRVCSKYGGDPMQEQNQAHFLSYIKERVKCMEPHEKTVVLMLDEIHIKPYFDYKGGSIVGSSANSQEAATTAHVFMVQSLLSANKDVIHILPVSKMNSEILHEYCKKIILEVESMGLKVIAVVTDNNSLNRKMMSLFSRNHEVNIVYPHPADKSRPLFFVIDPVHILKCVRNNWINQKNEGTCFYFPEMSLSGELPVGPPRMKAASFEAVRQLYSSEKTSLLKFGYKLNAKAVNPTPMERQNVKLVLNVMNPFIANALEMRGEAFQLMSANSTALFINIITNWWKVVNVKSPSKGRRLNDSLQNPVTTVVDQQLTFLNGMVDWLDAWRSVNMTSGCMTKETHTALRLTCYSLVELSRYCLEDLKFRYVLLGKFQTDTLEDRFGRYRQLAGAQYHISVRQLLESEKKIRLQKLLMLPQPENNSASDTEEIPQHNFSVLVSDEEISSPKHDMEVVAYIAGYCAHSALKKVSCTFCRSVLILENRDIEVESTKMIANLSRGGLKFPQPCTVHMVLITTLVVEKLTTGENANSFLASDNQRAIVSSISASIIGDVDPETCENGHTTETLVRQVVRAATNVALNNFCRLQNDTIHSSAQKKAAERKMKTLSKK